MKACRQWVLMLLAASFVALSYPQTLEGALDSVLDSLQSMANRMDDLQSTVKNLAKQTMAQQLFVEERIRSDGSSGLKQVRTYVHGTSSYFDSTHIGKGVAAIHDHSNYKNTVGMGETVVVLNGVEFRTRHNDYKLVRASTTSTEFHATEPIEPPRVPRAVTRKSTVDEEIQEMREFFKAFGTQNDTHRDYKPYFKPILCYMEGAWTLDDSIREPFESDRHQLIANDWAELLQQIRYTSYSGAKNYRENYSFLPSTIMGVNETTGKPIYAQWNYRILCHPFSKDIPTSYFKQQDDLSYRESRRRTLSKVSEMRAARYRLSEFDTERFTGFTLLDEIMGEIPGADNIPPFLNEEPMEGTIYTKQFSNFTELNTGYYHRQFKTAEKGAMGLLDVERGFSDELLFVAETTQKRIAPMSVKHCYSKRNCVTRETRFTYAIPLEIIYLTPLLTWNPFDLPIWDKDIVTADGRVGRLTKEKAYNGTSEINNYYLTPVAFYSSSTADEVDPADTVRDFVGVLDKNGVLRQTAASGNRVLTTPIPGIGRCRTRYPIPPIHGEGSTVWKELEVVKKKLDATKNAISDAFYHFELYPTSVTGQHTHEFYVTKKDYDDVVNHGIVVSLTTSVANGHSHEIDIWMDPNNNRLEYKTCGNEHRCWDRHPKPLILISD